MTLRLRTPKGANFYIIGTHLGRSVYKTTATSDAALATLILAKVEGEINAEMGTPYDPFADLSNRLERARSDWTHLYCIESLDYVKVGLADNPDSRLHELELGNPHGMRIAELWKVRPAVALIVEARIHAMLSEFSVGREWFKTTPDRVREAMAEYNSQLA